MKLNYLKCACIQTVYPIKLKFATSDIGCFVVYCVDIDEYRSNGVSTGVKARFLYITTNGDELFKMR